MSDKIFLPSEIPEGYIYGEVTRDYVDLYNKSDFRNETTTYYRIYYNYSSGLVVPYTRTFGNYTTSYSSLPVSRDFFDRPDFFSIVIIVFIIAIFGLWLTNIVTSAVRKGGLLGGLF